MNKAEEQIVANAMKEMVEFIWDIVLRARQHCASVVDEARAQVLARELGRLADWYEENGGTAISSTTLWMVREVIDAVSEITTTRRKSL